MCTPRRGECEIVTVEELAVEHECIEDVDISDGARPIDIEMLSDILEKLWIEPPQK